MRKAIRIICYVGIADGLVRLIDYSINGNAHYSYALAKIFYDFSVTSLILWMMREK